MREYRCGWKSTSTRPSVRLARRGDGRGDLRRMVGVVVDDRDAVVLADELEAPARPRNRARRARRPPRATPASSSAASAEAALRRLCSPGAAAANVTGSSSPPRTTCGTSREPALEQLLDLRADANVAWWSRSTFVTTAICGRSGSIVRSDSSPSTTSQPSPAPALPPSWAPRRRSGTRDRGRAPRGRTRSSRSSSSSRARRRRRSTASARRARRGTPPAAARRRPGRPSRRSPPSRRARPARARSRPARRRAWREVRRLDAVPAPHLGAPRAREERVGREPGAADPDEPEPPTGERLQARSAPRRSRRPRADGPAQHRRAHRREPRRVGEQRVDHGGTRSSSVSGTTTAPPPRSKWRAFLRLVVGGRVRIRDEHGRHAGGRELPDRAARARDGEVGGGERGAELARRRDQHVVVAVHARAQRLVVALAGDVQHRRSRRRRRPRPRAR